MKKQPKRWALVNDDRRKVPQYPWFATWYDAQEFREANGLRPLFFIHREDYVRGEPGSRLK